MGWIPGWPQDPADPKGDLAPHAVVLHRTYGGWGGGYSVGKNQGLFQFLIGKDDGQYVQFMSTDSVAWHCNGANFRAFGVELTGTNEDHLTDWQTSKLNEILRYAHDTYGIPLSYQDPITTPQASIWVNQSNFTGIISHVSVQTDDGSEQHTDYVTVPDYLRALGKPPATTPLPLEDDVMILYGPVFGRIGNVAYLVAGSVILDDTELGSEDKGGGSNGIPNSVIAWNLKPGHLYQAKSIDTGHMKKLRHINGLV